MARSASVAPAAAQRSDDQPALAQEFRRFLAADPGLEDDAGRYGQKAGLRRVRRARRRAEALVHRRSRSAARDRRRRRCRCRVRTRSAGDAGVIGPPVGRDQRGGEMPAGRMAAQRRGACRNGDAGTARRCAHVGDDVGDADFRAEPIAGHGDRIAVSHWRRAAQMAEQRGVERAPVAAMDERR